LRLLDQLDRTLALLEVQGKRAALLGGLAVSAWTEPRFTRDVDLAVAVDSDADAELLIRRLGEHGYKLWASVEQTATGRLATARLLPPDSTEDGVVVDLLFASSGIEPEIVAAAAPIDLGGRRATAVARVGHLVALKLLSADSARRPQDEMDLQSLRQALQQAEIQRAVQACELIMARGFNRDRNLPELLRNYLATSASGAEHRT
jgi:hypothetical protein